jgi:hypothetical protein
MGPQTDAQSTLVPIPVIPTPARAVDTQVASPGPRRGRRILRRILLIAGIVIILLAAAAGVGYAVFSPQIGALLVARDFCQHVEMKDYAAAYDEFSPDVQRRVPRADFLTISTRGDALEGSVIGCSVIGIDMSSDRQSVTIHSTVTRSLQGQSREDLVLSLEAGRWKIAEPPDPLLLPLTTALSFCQDIEQQNYTAAFGLLSVRTQAKVGNSLLFQGIFTASHFVTGNLKDCQVTSVALAASGAQLMVASTLVFEHFPSLTAHLVEVEESPGNWAVDTLTFFALGFTINVPPGS